MFALAIYDTLERRLVLARDRAGEKPLFYASLDGVLVVASELRAIASLPQLQRTLDARGVFDYLALRYVPAPRTILEGVHALEPGTLLAFAPGKAPRKRAFFAFDRVVDPAPRPEEEIADELESTLAQSLARRLIADVPLGAFLSSGIDSSLVCALGARKLGREIRTFCAGFAGGADDETAAASRIARVLGLPHTRYTISSDDLLRTVRDFGPCLDEPNGDRSCVPVYLLAREMRREVTVALSGDGGDELFCGYGRYAGFDKLREGLAAADSIEAYFERALPVFRPSALKTLLPEEYRAWQAEFLPLYAPVALRSGWTEAQRLSVLDFHTYMPGAVLAKVDRMSMRHALEVRTPFLEPRVMELAASLPRSLAPAAGSLKPALRQLLRRYLDEALIAPRKVGFGMPASFMRAHGEIFRRMFDGACETLRATEFFRTRPAVLEQLAALAPGNGNSLWALTVLGMWCETNGLARAR
jgi:asparagine synthase (glutamine-hydrolysing)